MRIWRSRYFVCVLVLMVLMLVGCDKDDDEWGERSLRNERDFVKGAISTVMTKMHWQGSIAGQIDTRRSLAQYILADHAALMAFFQSQEWMKMEIQMAGEVELYTFDENGNKEVWEGDTHKFWEKMYTDKVAVCADAYTIELEIDCTHADLVDIDDPLRKYNCKSTEFFEFHVVCKDEKGRTISNQTGGGGNGRDHSETCPWI